MGVHDQPNQAKVGLVFADGVLTITGTCAMNEAVATSLAAETSATTTVTSSGAILTWVTVITPTSAITSADNTIGAEIGNVAAPFA